MFFGPAKREDTVFQALFPAGAPAERDRADAKSMLFALNLTRCAHRARPAAN
jgi:hypothetical protein